MEASGKGEMRAEAGTHTFIILVWRRLCVLGFDFENLRGWFHDWPLYEGMSRCLGKTCAMLFSTHLVQALLPCFSVCRSSTGPAQGS